MNPVLTAYGALALAVVTEVTATSLLLKTEQFTRPGLTALMALLYIASFYFVTLSLRVLPLGVAYAVWAGCGIVLTSLLGVWVLRQPIDTAAVAGISLIVTGVVVIYAFSKAHAQ